MVAMGNGSFDTGLEMSWENPRRDALGFLTLFLDISNGLPRFNFRQFFVFLRMWRWREYGLPRESRQSSEKQPPGMVVPAFLLPRHTVSLLCSLSVSRHLCLCVLEYRCDEYRNLKESNSDATSRLHCGRSDLDRNSHPLFAHNAYSSRLAIYELILHKLSNRS